VPAKYFFVVQHPWDFSIGLSEPFLDFTLRGVDLLSFIFFSPSRSIFCCI